MQQVQQSRVSCWMAEKAVKKLTRRTLHKFMLSLPFRLKESTEWAFRNAWIYTRKMANPSCVPFGHIDSWPRITWDDDNQRCRTPLSWPKPRRHFAKQTRRSRQQLAKFLKLSIEFDLYRVSDWIVCAIVELTHNCSLGPTGQYSFLTSGRNFRVLAYLQQTN